MPRTTGFAELSPDGLDAVPAERGRSAAHRATGREDTPVSESGLSGPWHPGDSSAELTGPGDLGAQPAGTAPPLAKFHTPEIVFGPGSLAELGHCARRLGARRPFLVTDPGLEQAGWSAEAVGHLTGVGLRPAVWTGVTPNPKDHEIEAAYAEYERTGSDVIVAVGGGSCIDAAKGVAILSGNGGSILGYAGVDRVTNPIPPLIMVPSTSGTGADVSQFAVVTDAVRRTKVTIISRTLVPEISIVDPRLLVTMPDELNAATGLDALTHAIEAFVSLARNPLTDHHALQAARLVREHLPQTMVHRRRAAPRIGMAQGALQAGMAFTNAILGITHAMSHQVGGLLDAPHGVVNGILLPHTIRFNAVTEPGRYVPLASAVGLDTGGGPAEAADRLAEWVRELADTVGVPRRLSELGVCAGDLPLLARATLKDACLATNPRAAGLAEVRSLFQEAL